MAVEERRKEAGGVRPPRRREAEARSALLLAAPGGEKREAAACRSPGWPRGRAAPPPFAPQPGWLNRRSAPGGAGGLRCSSARKARRYLWLCKHSTRVFRMIWS